jgi:hypothetical protein
MKTFPLPTPSSSAPLWWEAFRHLGRLTNQWQSDQQAWWLARAASAPDFPLDERHQGLSLLVAALLGWRRYAPPFNPEVTPDPPTRFPLPGETWAATGTLHVPDVPAALLIHRGLDPFDRFETLALPAHRPHFKAYEAQDHVHCPLGLIAASHSPALLDLALRHPKCPTPAQMDALRTSQGEPWLHALLKSGAPTVPQWLAFGLNPNQLDAHGQTPLHHAQSRADVVLLLQAGASLPTSPKGRGPIDAWRAQGLTARESMASALTEHFLEHVASPEVAALTRQQLQDSQVFDAAYQGRFGKLPKTVERWPAPQTPAGFAEPLSLLGHALLGLLAGQPGGAGKGLAPKALELLIAQRPLNETERDLAIALALLHTPVSSTAYLPDDQRRRHEATAKWRHTLETQWLVPYPTPEEKWDRVDRAMRMVSTHLVETDNIGALERLWKEWGARSPVDPDRVFLETYAQTLALWEAKHNRATSADEPPAPLQAPQDCAMAFNGHLRAGSGLSWPKVALPRLDADPAYLTALLAAGLWTERLGVPNVMWIETAAPRVIQRLSQWSPKEWQAAQAASTWPSLQQVLPLLAQHGQSPFPGLLQALEQRMGVLDRAQALAPRSRGPGVSRS